MSECKKPHHCCDHQPCNCHACTAYLRRQNASLTATIGWLSALFAVTVFLVAVILARAPVLT